MGFESIKDEVLVACGRHCSICHKFCGIKIELHHIKLVSEGGDNSMDNCIPLCFDCHADMRSYDSKHPKGTKYSHKELKMHRDKWYGNVKNNLGTGTTEHLTQDINTFKIIIQILKPGNSISFIRHHNFGYSFDTDYLDDFSSLINKFDNEPWIEFFDVDLEALRSELFKLISTFDTYIGKNTWPLRGASHKNGVPAEWETDQPERFDEVIENIHQQTTGIVACYDKFIRLSRSKLGVDVA